MKRLVSSVLLFFLTYHAFAQLGNEWIDYQRTYFKIPVASEGIYRITYQALSEAGFPVSADPTTFRIFHRGKEQAIVVTGEDDRIFHPTDHIEFYGTANDGTLDASLYEHPEQQPHTFYNLYSDTTAYFLTYGLPGGKRMTAYTGAAAAESIDHHLSSRLLLLKDQFSAGVDYGSVRKTSFDTGEGWTGVQILQNQEVVYHLEGVKSAATSAGKPSIEVLLTGRGAMSHHVQLSSASRTLASIEFQAYQSYRHVQQLEWSDIDGEGKFSLKVRVTGLGGSDRVSVGYVRLTFPKQNVISDTETILFVNAISDAPTLRFTSAPDGVRFYDVSDPDDVTVLAPEEGEAFSVPVPPSSDVRKLLATVDLRTPSAIRRVIFRHISPALHDYVIVSHPSLRRPALGYTDPVRAYGEYRALPAGGGFDTLVVNIDQLYDQFNYGEASPRAIFQFMRFLASRRMPEYLFLVGKGLNVNYGYRRNPTAFHQFKDLVPTAGFPASDMAFTLGLGDQPLVPAVATGRLTATDAAEVATYLNKVIEHEAVPYNALWRKKLLHLSGGIEENEPALFRQFMQEFESVAESLYLGASVEAVSKQTTDSKLINLAEEINSGVGLVTFFGHSAPNTLDFDIGLASDPVMGYNNAGRYPFLLMNGCDVGSFFLNTNIMGENWIKTPQKGAIGFIAHSSYGLVSGLHHYTSTFYNVAFGDSVFIKRSVGKVQQEVTRRYLQAYGTSSPAITQTQQMVLLGDPAVRIFGADKTDYAINNSEIAVTAYGNAPLTALSDSFAIRVPVNNFGIAHASPVTVEVVRRYGETVVTYDSIFPPILFSDTLTFVIRNMDDEGFGINTFTVRIDVDNTVDELSEENNLATLEYFIPLHGTRNLYPYDYAIVTTTEPHLSFQHTDQLSGSRDYILEIDTTSTFGSGFKQRHEVPGEVLLRKRVTLLTTDSVVYYWRTRLAQPRANESANWVESSFTYISDGSEGWAQLRYPQFARNEGAGLVADPEIRRLRFEETVTDVAAKTFSSASEKPRDSVSFRINGVEYNLFGEGAGCRNNTINLVAFDRRAAKPYPGIYFTWHQLLFEYGGRRLLCGREPHVINSFSPGELVTHSGDDLLRYVDNIATGDSVVLFSIGDAGYSLWPEEAREKLAALGVSVEQLGDVNDGDPVVIFGRKGSLPGSALFFRADPSGSSVNIRKTIVGRATSGTMTSKVVGPARTWDRLIVDAREREASDNFHFTVLGIRPDHKLDTLMTDLVDDVDLSHISAEAYPYLHLILTAIDDVELTPVQLTKWLVLYQPVAEGLVFYDGPRERQTVYQGQTYSTPFGFINISDKNFSDSLIVRYDLLNHGSGRVTPSSARIVAPSPGDTTLFLLDIKTANGAGLNDVEVFVNPRLQHERTYENNLIVLRDHLQVDADLSHPVLEVTFDGRHLVDNDHVAVNPLIAVELWDENRFMLKNDTTGVRILLQYPCTEGPCSFQTIYFSREDVTWRAATDTSRYGVYFQPANLADGHYKLRVEIADAAGNASGGAAYEIAFRVSRQEFVTLAAPYPNPFEAEVVFEVALTGTGNASYSYTLLLRDVHGRSVGEVFGDTSRLHIGTNKIIWDGRDSGGSLLPGGIYVYRLQISQGGSTNEYYGKVLLRR